MTNWTGDGLTRSRFTETTRTAKQNYHFAKARGRRVNGSPPSPAKIEFFECGERTSKCKSMDFSPKHWSDKIPQSHLLKSPAEEGAVQPSVTVPIEGLIYLLVR